MSNIPNLAVPKGSTVLVTGANGLLGSHISDQFLSYGYNVRGTVRDVEKNSWLAETFQAKYGKNRFELFKVADMATEGAYNDAVKGVSVVAHSASVMSMDHDPNNVIPAVISGAINALKAAYSEKSVRRFVFTSSSAAAVISAPHKVGITVTEQTWNETAIQEAWADPPYTIERVGAIYAASKTEGERAVWKYHNEHQAERPELVVNTVLPNVNFGRSVDPINQGFPSSNSIPYLLWKGQVSDVHRAIFPQYFIDTSDNGRLHVAAAILEHVQGQRIFGFAQKFSLDLVLESFRKLMPNKTFPENLSGGEDDNIIVPRQKAEELLRELGRPGWTSVEESLRNMIEDLKVADSKK